MASVNIYLIPLQKEKNKMHTQDIQSHLFRV